MSKARLSACMLISYKDHNNTLQVYSVTVMTHVKALQAGQSSEGTSEPITPASIISSTWQCKYVGASVILPPASIMALML